jgi:predicted permease
MSLIKALRARARSLFGGVAESRMEEEFQFHLEMEAARLVREGVGRDEAHRRARVAFGGLDRHREEMRDGRGARWFGDFRADVRYAMRAMLRRPGFTVATAVTLGLGVGLSGIVFGYVNSLLFRPIPARAPAELVSLFRTEARSGNPRQLGYEDYLDYRNRSGAFADVAGFDGTPLNLVVPGARSDAAADLIWAEMVTENYFTLLDMRPAAGRFFAAADAPQGANAFAVLSYEAWRKRFGGDPNIAGRVVRVNGTPFTIVAVAPSGFRGMRTFGFWPEMWVPIGMHLVARPGSTALLTGRGGGSLMTVARMNPGWERRRTELAAQTFAKQLATAYPESNAETGALVIPAKVGFDNPAFVKPGVLVLASALGIFASLVTLLIICANLANLQLARAAERGQEMAIRLSLGGARARLVRQLLTESAVLAIPGVLIALAMPSLTPMLESSFVPKLQFQVGFQATPDLTVMLFTGGVALFAVALFGLVPALRASRTDLRHAMSNTAGSVGGARRPSRLRGMLVVSQLALSVILLVGGALFVRSLIAARSMDFGFDLTSRAFMSVNLGLQGYDEARGRKFYDDVIARVRSLPDVVSASWGFPVPFDTYGRGIGLYVEGAKTNSRDGTIGTEVSYVAEGFLDALGLRLQAGRDFAIADSAGTPRVLIVSRELATRLWPSVDPIGRRGRLGAADGPEFTVIGVVGDARFTVFDFSTTTRAYLSMRQRYRDSETLVVHTRGAPSAVIPRLERIVAEADPTLPVFGITTIEEGLDSGLAASRTAARIAGFFGLLGLLIAAVGLYAVVASSVTERTREMGVRMALGATPRDAMRQAMVGGVRLGVIGLAIGLVGAVAVSRLLAGLLFGLSPSDPVTFVGVPIALGLIVLLATYLPARRVARLDPVAALRTLVIAALLVLPRMTNAQVDAGRTAFDRGRAAFTARKFDDAAKHFEDAVKREPGVADYHLWLGHAYTRQLKGANFIRQGIIGRKIGPEYDRAVALAPTSVEAAEARLEFYMEAPGIAGGGMDHARAELERLTTINRYRGLTWRGRLEMKANRPDKAEEAYRALSDAFPDSGAAVVVLATFYQDRARFSDAFAAIDARLEKAPDDTNVVYQVGRAAALSGQQLDRGERALRRFLAMLGVKDSVSQSNAHWRLGMIGEKRADMSMARAEYQRAIDLNPAHEAAGAALKRLGGR